MSESTEVTQTEAIPAPTPETPKVEVSSTPVTEEQKTILISEIYVCSQGEGPLVGTPSILVRTSTCNLRCRWADPKTGKFNLCDTPFTSWNPELNNPMTSQQIYDQVIKLAMYTDEGKPRENVITHVIVSGGEPTLWGTEMANLCLGFIATGIHVTVETNGTKYIEVRTKQKIKKKEFDMTSQMLFSISPKLKSSVPTGSPFEKEHEKERINYLVLEEYLKRYPSYLKFVVTSEEDLAEVQEIQKKLHLAPARIYLMPEGITREQIAEHGPAVNDLCIKYGYRYSPREHITLYNNKRKT